MQTNILELLDHIDPSVLDYQQWCNVGMALKEEGFSADVWDEWSRQDAARYHPGECQRKWNGFTGSRTPVKGGTIAQYAMEQGYVFPSREEGAELAWDGIIGGRKQDTVVVDTRWLEGRDVPPPPRNFDGHEQARQLSRYLETLFEAGETVGYVTSTWEKDGKYLPSKGDYSRTAGELIEALAKCDGDVGAVLGDYKPEAGAWIRFNPLDGQGVKDSNITDYRYALVESDERSLEDQYAILHELELPIAMLVHSGKKSLHAVVRVNAANFTEYRQRVDYLYNVCEKNGLKLDTQNRNPSRLSRMPGVMRNGRPQYIVASNIGKASWDEWREWIEAVNDDLPEPESISDVWKDLPQLSPPLIHQVLRQGHKMLIAGPSKAGKSFALIELCIAIAEGREWFNWKCTQGRVMYVNLELDRSSCLHRFKDVYETLGWQPEHLSNIDVWNLRGKAIPMDKLAPKLIRRASKRGYIAIVIDPIYKVITGDENSADQMANFCNQFDKVCTELGCAVIYCHHHSKGTQGNKRSMDRASGSGVFARDPDAMLDMIELDVSDALRKQAGDRAYCDTIARALDRNPSLPNWRNEISQDDALVPQRLTEAMQSLMGEFTFRTLCSMGEDARRRAERRTAWRIEGTLREFPSFKPVNLWFDYPIHRPDDNGALEDLSTEDTNREQRGSQSWKKKGWQAKKEKQSANWDSLRNGFSALKVDGQATIADLMEYSGLSRNAVKSWVDHQTDLERGADGVIKEIPLSDRFC